MESTVFRKPVIDRPIMDTEDLIDHLKPMIERELGNEISRTYFGDIEVYLPGHFKGPRNSDRVVLVFNPAYDRLEEGTRTAASEYRLIGLDIIGFVDITPYFKASPDEAYGERRLASFMRKLRTYLTQQVNTNLDGRVQNFLVGDVNWARQKRDNLSIRGAGLEIQARVRVPRQRET